MPCYRCGARQVDPDRGESPWKRGVVTEHQVLICPPCQSSFDWQAALDRCPVCESAHLVRRLGEIECRDCGHVRDGGAAGGVTLGAGDAGRTREPPPAAGPASGSAAPPPGLAEEVERALEKVLGRTRRTAGIG
jgi:hypothetical protein